MTPFSLPLSLLANPYLFDYVHSIHLIDDGRVEMFAAAGQEMISISRGRFALRIVNELEAMVSFFELIEIDLETTNEKLRDIGDFQASIVAESGVFAFPRSLSPSHPEAEWPFDVYRTRYVFSVDPLRHARENAQQTVFYNLVMTPDQINSERYYYSGDHRIRASVAEVQAMGIITTPT